VAWSARWPPEPLAGRLRQHHRNDRYLDEAPGPRRAKPRSLPAKAAHPKNLQRNRARGKAKPPFLDAERQNPPGEELQNRVHVKLAVKPGAVAKADLRAAKRPVAGERSVDGAKVGAEPRNEPTCSLAFAKTGFV